MKVVARSKRGVLHKAERLATGVIRGHARCHVAPDAETFEYPGAAFDAEFLRHPSVYCRYRWCFRDVVVELGIDPVVGHLARKNVWRERSRSSRSRSRSSWP